VIRVLLVDDSPTARLLMRHIISSQADMQLIGEASNGEQAVELVRATRPDVILMDIVMPVMDGLEATKIIMAQTPTPIVMVSAAMQGQETEMAFRAIKQGALTLLPKPVGPDHADFPDQAVRLSSTLRAMAGVRVIHHIVRPTVNGESAPLLTPLQQTLQRPPEIAAVVASTGGPAALAEIFQELSPDFRLPIVVVQHIAGDFLESLVGWLNRICPLKVELAVAGQRLYPGRITFAPTGKHLTFDAERKVVFQSTPQHPHTPSGDVLFESVAERFGAAAIGVILTGMGADGAAGLLAMRQHGGVTIAQDAASSAVYGMPREAVNMGAAQHSLPLTTIPRVLNELALAARLGES
jgi:two-component system, chemotaxis family, protein-glutamate methylesterase/glutaminase